MSKKALLMILDGWGLGDQKKDDVIFNTPTPYWDYLMNNYPHSQLQASGENVGLPDGQMGNSEVGHLNIGAGAVHLIAQELKKGLHVITYREKFIFLSYFPHLDPASKRNQFRPSRKTDFTHAPYIAADNHIAAHQLVALGTGNETYPVVEIIGIAHHTVYPVFVVFLPVLGKRRQQAFVIQKRR